MTGTLKAFVVASSLFLAVGCAGLPDFSRLQGNMDHMVHYMGIMASNMPSMAHSTGRMAAMAEKMERKSDGLIADLQKKGAGAERAVQNYSQAFLDNDRAVIKNLQGIRQELGDLRQSLRQQPAAPAESQDQARINAGLQAKLNELEARLAALSSKLDKIDKKFP